MEDITIASALAHIVQCKFHENHWVFCLTIQKMGNMDFLHIVFLWVYLIDAHTMWYFSNQNYIIFKVILLEISGENQKCFKSSILLSVLISQLENRGILTPFATQHSKFKS